jgi:ATP-dependent Clp protease adapter protein ClpS
MKILLKSDLISPHSFSSKSLSSNYRVILLNDPECNYEYVKSVLIKLTDDLSVGEIERKIYQLRTSGRAILKICEQDLAEKLAQNLRDNNLISIIESD